ncbi:hypothetical protein K490DRAFT_53812 [Saccharata proteae CBS 121410]|uniref:Uncharacterized protein n=1 Tax=Saccharata proteae CBS 121410 TaxID=1314787 RepID=A0A9P4HX56_9PEZI|nr:hypothetical protein K490DRAFT_53812 [Saccharata proteae CBS 121410]
MEWIEQQEDSGEEKTCPYCGRPAYTRVDEASYFVHQLDKRLEEICSTAITPPQHVGAKKGRKPGTRATLGTEINYWAYIDFIGAWENLSKIYTSLPRSGLNPALFRKASDTDIFRRCLKNIEDTMEDSFSRRQEFAIIRWLSIRASEDDYGATLFLEIMEKAPLGQKIDWIHIDACIPGIVPWSIHKTDLELFFGRALAYMELHQRGMIRIPKILQ